MNKKPVEWEDVWKECCQDEFYQKDEILNFCKRAERSGLICRNVPDQTELEKLCMEFIPHKDSYIITNLVDAISARLRGEHPDRL